MSRGHEGRLTGARIRSPLRVDVDWLVHGSVLSPQQRGAVQRKGLGLGFERDLTENTRLIGGAYRNSHYRTSVYAGCLTADPLGQPYADRCAG